MPIIGEETLNSKKDKVYLKNFPMKGVVRFDQKGKLIAIYVGNYEIFQRVGKVSHELKLPSELSLVHGVFHVSTLMKCIGNVESILPVEGLVVKEKLSFEELLVEILDHQVKSLRNKESASVKALWRNHLVERVTWEAKAEKKSRYPHTFTSEG
ncbi:uncharacterized protein LOC107001276 [Solanum pennellii]|uniref:Uncharacterized protein LOC107001276 n=1 Tax=Solanum pennellii TaxID=28526 RepID=A0ABM1FCF6_SOLPN|nr:uncharacterized protein LOC107001276 [Solanum pennellii]